jgi:hypothetical protein
MAAARTLVGRRHWKEAHYGQRSQRRVPLVPMVPPICRSERRELWPQLALNFDLRSWIYSGIYSSDEATAACPAMPKRLGWFGHCNAWSGPGCCAPLSIEHMYRKREMARPKSTTGPPSVPRQLNEYQHLSRGGCGMAVRRGSRASGRASRSRRRAPCRGRPPTRRRN